jgi:hypothetical protein
MKIIHNCGDVDVNKRSVWKITSGALLTKEALRKKFAIYKKNVYVLKLLLNIATVGIEADIRCSAPPWHCASAYSCSHLSTAGSFQLGVV